MYRKTSFDNNIVIYDMLPRLRKVHVIYDAYYNIVTALNLGYYRRYGNYV